MEPNTIVTKTRKAKELIRKAIDKFGKKVAVSCSFGKDSMVVVHLALQVKKDFPIFSVMTKFKPKETFKYMEEINNLWNLNLQVYQSEVEVDSELYRNDPDACCMILKVEPMKRAVAELDAWICGLRKTEGRTRKEYMEVERRGALVKFNPILEWTELDVWKYIAINEIPVHPWYVKGYRSLGCEPCTKLIPDEKLEREGRWQGTSKCGGECGIHTKVLKAVRGRK